MSLTTTQRIELVLDEGGSCSFTELCRLAGLDPRVDFRFSDLRGVDFSNQDLREFDFSGAWLEGCNFSGANIAGAKMIGAHLSGGALSAASGLPVITVNLPSSDPIARSVLYAAEGSAAIALFVHALDDGVVSESFMFSEVKRRGLLFGLNLLRAIGDSRQNFAQNIGTAIARSLPLDFVSVGVTIALRDLGYVVSEDPFKYHLNIGSFVDYLSTQLREATRRNRSVIQPVLNEVMLSSTNPYVCLALAALAQSVGTFTAPSKRHLGTVLLADAPPGGPRGKLVFTWLARHFHEAFARQQPFSNKDFVWLLDSATDIEVAGVAVRLMGATDIRLEESHLEALGHLVRPFSGSSSKGTSAESFHGSLIAAVSKITHHTTVTPDELRHIEHLAQREVGPVLRHLSLTPATIYRSER